MKIAIVAFTFAPDINGVANVAYRQANFFRSIGYEVHIITKKCIKRDKNANELKNLIVHEFDVDGNSLLYNFYRGEVLAYIKFLQNFQCDVMIFHCWQIWSTDLFFFTKESNISYKTIFVSHCTGIKTKNTVREYLNTILFVPYRFIMKSLIKRFNHLVFLSDLEDNDRFYDIAFVKNNAYWQKCSVIPNGLEINEFCDLELENILLEYGLIKNEYIICVSNYQNGKNQLEAIKIFERIAKDKKIIFIGDYRSEYFYALNDYVSKLSNNQNIKFLVSLSQEKIKKLVYASKLFLFTSRNECMPLVILEAIGLGVPILSSNVGNVSRMHGVICYNSVDDAVNKLNNLLINDTYYSKVKNEILDVRKKLLWKENFRQYLEIIQALTK